MTARFCSSLTRKREELDGSEAGPELLRGMQMDSRFRGNGGLGVIRVPWAARSGYGDSNMALTTV